MYSFLVWWGRVYPCFVCLPCGSPIVSCVLFSVWTSFPVFCTLSLAPKIHSRWVCSGSTKSSDMVLARGCQTWVLVAGSISSSYSISGCCALVGRFWYPVSGQVEFFFHGEVDCVINEESGLVASFPCLDCYIVWLTVLYFGISLSLFREVFYVVRPVLFLCFASCVSFSVLFSPASCVLAVPVFWAFPWFSRSYCCPGLSFGLAYLCSASGVIMILIDGCVGVGSESFGSTPSSRWGCLRLAFSRIDIFRGALRVLWSSCLMTLLPVLREVFLLFPSVFVSSSCLWISVLVGISFLSLFLVCVVSISLIVLAAFHHFPCLLVWCGGGIIGFIFVVSGGLRPCCCRGFFSVTCIGGSSVLAVGLGCVVILFLFSFL